MDMREIVEPSAQEQLLSLAIGGVMSKAIGVMAELDIADLLAVGPRSVDELASASGAHAPSLRRVLRLLATAGVVTGAGEGTFALGPLGELLRDDAPGSMRALLRML